MVLAGIGIVIFFLAVGASLVAMALRQRPVKPPTTDNRPPPKPRRQLVATTRPPKAQQINYKDERRLITLALADGMVPGAIWPLLRGSPQARKRRVLKVARRLARPAVAPSALEVAAV